MSEENNTVEELVLPEPPTKEDEAAKYKDLYIRQMAENENIRKRFAKDLEEERKYGINKFARDLIDVLENLHRAEASINSLEQLAKDETLKQVFTGIELTKKSLIDAFEKHGIKRLDPQVGEAFNHDFHQAITQIPSAEQPENAIVQVIQAGYVIKDRLLRPALVVVSKGTE